MSDTSASTVGTLHDSRPASPPPIRLKLADNAGAPSGAMPQLVTLVGGRRDCHLPIHRPEVSKVHCAIVQTGRGYLVCDLGTRAGTYVNDNPIHVAPLAPGDRLRVGLVEIAVDLPAMPVEPCAPPAVEIRLNGRSFDLAQTALVVGRRGGCDLALDTPDVSLAHALVFAYCGQPVVFDLGSRSGTLVNGRRVHLSPLRNGDQLNIGGVDVHVGCEPSVSDSRGAALTAVPTSEEAQGEAASADPKAEASEPRTADHWHRAVATELAVERRQLERRTLDLDRRAAELDTLANLLALESEHLERLKADRGRREAEIEQAEKEARDRLALAASHEQAVTAAWEELERWHARHRKQVAGAEAEQPLAGPPMPESASPGAFINIARPYPAQEPPGGVGAPPAN